MKILGAALLITLSLVIIAQLTIDRYDEQIDPDMIDQLQSNYDEINAILHQYDHLITQ